MWYVSFIFKLKYYLLLRVTSYSENSFNKGNSKNMFSLGTYIVYIQVNSLSNIINLSFFYTDRRQHINSKHALIRNNVIFNLLIIWVGFILEEMVPEVNTLFSHVSIIGLLIIYIHRNYNYILCRHKACYINCKSIRHFFFFLMHKVF